MSLALVLAKGAKITVKRRVYISASRDIRLDQIRQKIKQAIVDEITGMLIAGSATRANSGGPALLPLCYQTTPSYQDRTGSRFVRLLDLSVG
jgi:hypothetical protein